jgi:hypothetical protein
LSYRRPATVPRRLAASRTLIGGAPCRLGQRVRP